MAPCGSIESSLAVLCDQHLKPTGTQAHLSPVPPTQTAKPGFIFDLDGTLNDSVCGA